MGHDSGQPKKTHGLRSSTEQKVGQGGTRKGRRTPRRVFNQPIGILCHGTFAIVQATQMSEGGLGFVSETGFVANSKVVISLALPGGEVVVARAEILAPHEDELPGHFAAKFLEISLQQKRLIRNYVTAKTAAEAEDETADKKKNDAA